jgi:hypothetical protein
MKANEIYKVLEDAGIDFEVVEVMEGVRTLRFDVEETFEHGKLWYCQGYWNDDQKPMTVLVCDGEWDGIEDGADQRISFYTDGKPVMGDHGDFTVTHSEEYAPDWWENKMAGVQLP